MKKIFYIFFIAFFIMSCKTDIPQTVKFTVEFDSAGGTIVDDQIVEKGKNVNKPTDPERTGYSFIGWYKDGTLFDFSKSITSKITLTAKWNPNKYTIIFNETNDSVQEIKEQFFFYDEEKSLFPNSYKAPVGMKFAGWTIKRGSSSISYNDRQLVKNLSSENNSIIQLYAVWIEKDAHSISYLNTNFAIDNSENPKKYFESKNIELKNIERKGYDFEGWFTDVNCSDNSKISGWKAGEQTTDLILYAKWTPINYTISYEGLEGAINPNATTYIITDNWLLKSPQKDGYWFMGWKNGDKTITNISDAGGSNITLTAQWEIIQYNLYYVLGNSTVEYQQYTIDQDVILMTPNIIGYNFAGWFESENFGPTEEQITGWKKGEKTGTIFLYAKKEPKSYTINFDSCGGTAISSQIISYNSIVTQPKDPVYADHNFMGWYFDSEQTIMYDFSKPFVFPESFEDTENVTLYAKWGTFVFVEGATVLFYTEINEITNLLPEGEEKPDYFSTHHYKHIIPNLYVCDHEITQAEYTEYCCYSGKNKDEKPKYDIYKPVTYVTWTDAIVYCNLRSIAEGLSPAYFLKGKTNPAEWVNIKESEDHKFCGGLNYWDDLICDFPANGYRLPTIVEWEYIAREGPSLSDYLYSGSNNIDEVAWYKNNSSDSVHYGKLKKPNSLGIYDMSGNVDEWCWETDRKYIDLSHWFDFAMKKGGNYTLSADTDYNNCVLYKCIQIERKKQYNNVGFRVIRNATE